MDKYLENSKRFGWGQLGEPLNIHKTQLLDKYSYGRTLDVACATGRYTNHLATLGRDVQGIDLQSELIAQARKTYGQIKFQVASAYKLPFRNNTFDTVVLFDVLEHIDDVKAIKEAIRVGKRLIISVPHENQEILTKNSFAHHHYMDRTHLREYTQKSLTKLLKSLGLSIIMCEETLPVSVTALATSHLSKGSKTKAVLIRMMLRLFGKEAPIHSTVLAVAEKKK